MDNKPKKKSGMIQEWEAACARGPYGYSRSYSPIDGHVLTEEEIRAMVEEYRKSDAYKEDMERLARGEKI